MRFSPRTEQETLALAIALSEGLPGNRPLATLGATGGFCARPEESIAAIG